jgi:hypothetical protein
MTFGKEVADLRPIPLGWVDNFLRRKSIQRLLINAPEGGSRVPRLNRSRNSETAAEQAATQGVSVKRGVNPFTLG